MIPGERKAPRPPEEHQMASCCRVAASGDYLVKQKEGKKVNTALAADSNRACVLQAAVVQPGRSRLARVQVALSLSLWSAEEMGFGGNTLLNSNF